MSDPDGTVLAAAALLRSALVDREGCALLACQIAAGGEAGEVLGCLAVLAAEMAVFLAGPEIPGRMLDVVVATADEVAQ